MTDEFTKTLEAHGFRKECQILDRATGKRVVIISFPNSDGRREKLEISPSALTNHHQLKGALLDRDAELPQDGVAQRELFRALEKAIPGRKKEYAARAGWNKKFTRFALVDRVIRNGRKSRCLGLRAKGGEIDPSGKLSTMGTLDGWRDTVATPAGASSTMMTMISAAFAAPLLAFAGEGSFSINVYGRSRTGKSMTTLAASSVYGIGQSEDLPTWVITDTALGQTLPRFNDMLFPIDDLAAMEGSDREKYNRLHTLAYRLASGLEKGRDEGYMIDRNSRRGKWRSIVLTQYESSISELARKVGIERKQGEALRLIDVPAVLDGSETIFDRAPSGSAASATWREPPYKAIFEGCAAHRGVALDAYVSCLIKKRSRLREIVGDNIARFQKKVRSGHDGDEARDLARKFGLIYAGGRLGVRFGILPWASLNLLDAVAKSYRAARALLPDDGKSLAAGIAAFKRKRRSLPKVEADISRKKFRDAVGDRAIGFRQALPGKNRYVIRVEAFNEIFETDKQAELVESWLTGKGYLTLAKPKDGDKRRAKDQHIWPDKKRCRSFELIWPTKKKKQV